MSSEQPPKETILSAEPIIDFPFDGDVYIRNGDKSQYLFTIEKGQWLLSRPHPAPRLNTQPKGCTCEDCMRFRKEECPYPDSNITMDRCNSFLLDIVEHDAATARKAREDMLNQIDDFRKHQEDLMNRDDNFTDHITAWNCEKSLLKSLRTTTPQSEQEQPR